MKPVLLLHPDGIAEPGVDWPCVMVSVQATAALSLAEAARRLAGSPISVVLPVELFSCWSTGPWPGRRRPSPQALGYAIEEYLSVPLERLQLSAGPLDEARRCALRACDGKAFAAIGQALEAAGIKIAALHVDADLLPAHSPCALWLFNRWLMRGEGELRMALAAEDFARVCELSPRPWGRLNSPDDLPVSACQHLLLEPCAALDLLPARTGRRVWPASAIGLALAGLLLVECTANWAAAWQQRQAAGMLQAQTLDHLNALLPESLRGQPLPQLLKALQGPAMPGPRTRSERLQTLAEALLGARGVKIQRIEYRAGDGWKIHLSAPGLADVERLSERAAQQRLPLHLLNANQEAGRTLAVMALEDAS